VGRETRLNELAKLLELQGSRVLLTGMGGVGKSELALQYAYANLEHYRGGIVRLDARQGYEGMAAEVISFVRGRFPDLLTDKGPQEELLPMCWNRWPAAGSPPEPVLLVLDDLPGDGPGEQSASHLCAGLPPRFRRLITRRERGPSGVSSIDLDVLQRQDALQLLGFQAEGHSNGRGRIEKEVDAAISLCEEVGDLPLALVLLGARLAEQPDLLIASLLQDLKAEGAEARALAAAHPELGARQGVIESLLISWEPLSAPAKELAVLLSLMAPAVIPWELVEACGREEQELVEGSAFGEAQAELLRSQLLKRVGSERYLLHPLVRSFVKLQSEVPEHEQRRETLRRRFATSVANQCRGKSSPVSVDEPKTSASDSIPHIALVADQCADILEREDLAFIFSVLFDAYFMQANYSGSVYAISKLKSTLAEEFNVGHPSAIALHMRLQEVTPLVDQAENAAMLLQKAMAQFGESTQDIDRLGNQELVNAISNLEKPFLEALSAMSSANGFSSEDLESVRKLTSRLLRLMGYTEQQALDKISSL
jgi:hypothetical protein